jgi:hypothetical protein
MEEIREIRGVPKTQEGTPFHPKPAINQSVSLKQLFQGMFQKKAFAMGREGGV